MSDTGNKRVSQLTKLTTAEVQPSDLLLIIDITARESKNISVSDLGVWLNVSGSSFIENADTASYILGSNVHGNVNSSSYSLSSSFSTNANNSNNSISASYALSCSYALNGGSSGPSISSSWSSASISSSYSLLSNVSNTATTALNLFYNGIPNGTASYSITSETASYIAGGPTATASYAINSGHSDTSDISNSSNYLIFSSNNGTASYAMVAQSAGNFIKNQGIFLADTQSSNISQVDTVDVFWSTQTQARTPIEAVGTISIPFTSSTPTTGTLYLATLDRNTGNQAILDSTPISFILSPTMGTYGNYDSGSIKQTFSLMGQGELYGSYMVYVSSSNNIQIDSSRTVRFNISSESDTFSSYVNSPISFSVVPNDNSIIFTYTTNIGGPYNTTLPGLYHSMSLGNLIYTLDASYQFLLSSVNYLWTMTNVTESNFSNNPLLSTISGVPKSMTSLSCSNCALSSLYNFPTSSSLNVLNCNTNRLISLPNFPVSMSYLDCSYNQITSMPNLPATLSYLNCSNNLINNLPTLPYGLVNLSAGNNISLNSVPGTFPNTIISMSFDFDTSLNIFVSLPTSLRYFSVNYCPLTIVPTIPSPVLYLSAHSCSLSSFIIDNITSNLVSNGQINGYIDVRGNGHLDAGAQSNMNTLFSSGWTTLYDV